MRHSRFSVHEIIDPKRTACGSGTRCCPCHGQGRLQAHRPLASDWAVASWLHRISLEEDGAGAENGQRPRDPDGCRRWRLGSRPRQRPSDSVKSRVSRTHLLSSWLGSHTRGAGPRAHWMRMQELLTRARRLNGDTALSAPGAPDGRCPSIQTRLRPRFPR